MEILGNSDSAQGADVMTAMPVISSEEDLKKYLGQNEPVTPEVPAPASKPAEKKTDAGSIADPIDTDPNSPAENEEEQAPVEYPTMLHYLNEKHGLDLNLEGVTELNKEQEAEALDSIIERMTVGVNSALEEYQYIETLLQDAEIQQVLRAKQEGKSLRDLYADFSSSPAGANDDQLATQDFRKRFPKSSEEAIQGMMESLKKNGQFEPFVQGLREQHVEEQGLETQRTAQENKMKAEQKAAQDRDELERYSQFLTSTNAVYGIPLTQEMKETVFNMTTARDKTGLTQLDYALQSDEGTVLAALGIQYMKQLIQNGSSITKNRARGRVMDKIFDTPDKLQSGGSRQNQQDDLYSADVLNRY